MTYDRAYFECLAIIHRDSPLGVPYEDIALRAHQLFEATDPYLAAFEEARHEEIEG